MASSHWTQEAGRYTKGKNYLGDILFCLFRTLDTPFQYQLILHFSTPSTSTPPNATLLGLSPYNTTIVALMLATSIRHIFWKCHTSEQVMTPSFGIAVGIFNTVCNSLNTAASIWAVTSMAPGTEQTVLSSPIRILGMVLFVLGASVETLSELGRKSFKHDSRNKGKLYTRGWFGWARHVNSGAYLLWRSGLAVFCGGLRYGGVVAVYFAWYFTVAGIPPLDKYMGERYGSAWTEYKSRVPFKLIPGLY